ncbi:cupin domain-containing protein [Streptomyces sp. Wb2n-11]|uniref:cupin domain-containing protein n=1 Tax=Streptomyces sp. Wb2n-11 TaxID=1030533 RepID=UPI000B15A575|nr:cupin domain-containing protein [Streptomyces sp. Wb2n-11]
MTTTARASVQHEDEQVRVTRWDFEPGTRTGHHVHEYDYVVVPVVDGRISAFAPDGSVSESHLRAGQSYTRPAGGGHDVVNTGGAWLAFVEIELKGPPPVS